jgi:hypothetical protein
MQSEETPAAMQGDYRPRFKPPREGKLKHQEA